MDKTYFYPIDEMEEVVMEESPHHLYYLIVNEKDGVMTEDEGKRLIQKMNIYKKNVKMLVIKKDRMSKKDDEIKAVHENIEETI